MLYVKYGNSKLGPKAMNRVATLPGKPGKVREFENWPKNQGKVGKLHKIDWLASELHANVGSRI